VTCQADNEGSGDTALPILKSCARWGWVVCAYPIALPSGKKHIPHSTGGWVFLGTGLDMFGKSRLPQGSKPEPSNTQRVFKPATLSRPPNYHCLISDLRNAAENNDRRWKRNVRKRDQYIWVLKSAVLCCLSYGLLWTDSVTCIIFVVPHCRKKTGGW
jgi:hypothetical protein